MPPPRPLRRRRGAITIDVARAELEETTERDQIFDLLFEFARQYFDYTAVFVVHGEIAEGRDAFGDGASREKVARIGVPLDLPSILSAARERRAMLQRVPAPDGLDSVLMSDLGRSGKTSCVVLPVVVRTRVVAMLLGDGGDTGIDATMLADVDSIVGAATAAFERLIVRRKLKGSMMPAGMGASTAPGPNASMPPPTMVSEVSSRPAAEELAPPIRDLMTEPISRVGETLREPFVQALTPADEPLSGGRGKTDKPPPPANVLQVRRPSGAPIPREEPESRSRMPAVTAPSNLGGAAQQAIEASRAKSTSVAPRSRGFRGQAPSLDFGAVPAQASMFGGELGADETERKLLAEIQGAGGAASIDVGPPPSPKAESPAPQRAAPITDVSPVAMPSSPPRSAEMISADDSDVDVVDPDATPIAPPIHFTSQDTIETPLAPPVSEADVVPAPAPKVPPVPESSTRVMPVSEQQISVAAHRPPSARSDQSRALPSVIVDVASEYVGLVARVIAVAENPPAEGQSADDAETELLRAGGYAMPAIMARFPGPVTIERDRLADGALPRVADCGPVLRLVASQRRTALPFVLSHVEDPEIEKRFWATYLLTELVYPEVLEPILNRLFDPEPRVRRAARAAARSFAEAHPSTIVERLELVAMDGGEPRDRRALAIDALGETREALAVPALIPLLEDPDAEVTSAVRGALTTIVRQDFGPNSAKWRTWWEANKDRHRLEWLIDALMHDQAALRASAGEELKTITKEYFGYYDDLPKRERERAQSRYREWWNSVGRVRFSRASSSRS